MTENKKNRKSTRSFSLEKPVERHFDIEKDENVVAAPITTTEKSKDDKTEPKEPKPTSLNQNHHTTSETEKVQLGGVVENPKGKKKWYAAALAGIFVLGGGGYYLSQQGNEGDVPVAEVVAPAKSADVLGSEAPDASQDEQSQTEAKDEVADNGSNEAPEGGTPAQPVQSQDDATLGMENATTALASDISVRSNPSMGGTASRTDAAPTVSVTGTVEEEAIEVIRGKYGNGAARKRNLGDRYAEIQSKVNEMYRNGQVN